MKTIKLILLLLLVASISFAQNGRVKQITTGGSNDGVITGITLTETNGTLEVSVVESNGNAYMSNVFLNLSDLDSIVSMTFTDSTLTLTNLVGIELTSPIPLYNICLLYTSPSPRDATLSRMPSSA